VIYITQTFVIIGEQSMSPTNYSK